MAKAIHWPRVFREEILAEDSESLFSAFRLGRFYYEGRYWAPDEEVDIRCDHLKIRRAIVRGDLKCCPIKDLSPADLKAQKPSLQTASDVVRFLGTHYNQPVDENTEVTVVYYQNKPVVPEEVESQEDDTGRHF